MKIKFMYFNEFSIPQAVRQIIGSNSFYFHALKIGIANYTALAQKIKPEVEKLTRSTANLNTIVVAIKRFADSLEVNEIRTYDKKLEDIRISLTGSIIDISFNSESDDLIKILDTILKSGIGYNIFRTNKEIRLFADDDDNIRNLFHISNNFEGDVRQDLSKITITTSNKQDVHDIFSIISSILYNNQIQIYNNFFLLDEIVLILDVKDAAIAYEKIREKISNRNLDEI